MRLFAPPPPAPLLPPDEVNRRYPRMRLAILESTFIGYATYYLLRNNVAPISKEIEGALHYDKNMMGSILAITAITYGVGKFFMGSLSDRSDVRRFMPFGLLLSAICNFAFGAIPSYPVHLALWAMNGIVQGMGWGPCGRSIGHWFSVRERGLVFGIWNVSHNIGGGIAGYLVAWAVSHFGGWQAAFYVPGVISLMVGLYLLWRLRDTPQSEGLPPIEIYRDDLTEHDRAHGTQEQELGFRALFVENVLKNKWLWVFALANFFVYIVRYSMLDWGPTYLREMKGASLESGGLSTLILEFGGIPSTIALGWLSDKLGGRRGMVAFWCMVPILFAFVTILLNPPGRLWLDMSMLAIIGFFVYPALNLIAISGLDLTSKKAVGTAAGFIGMFGYLGRTVQAKGFGWMAHTLGESSGDKAAWDAIIACILASTVLSMVFLAFAWRLKPKS